jgi:hypothetical protein
MFASRASTINFETVVRFPGMGLSPELRQSIDSVINNNKVYKGKSIGPNLFVGNQQLSLRNVLFALMNDRSLFSSR